LEIHKKAWFKKKVRLLLIFLAVVLVVAIVFFALLLHRPAYYKPLDFAGGREVSLYLTNQLLPEFYNGLQLREPFELVVTQSGINDIVARFDWPQKFGNVKISSPMVFFAPSSVVVMATVVMDGPKLVGTIVAEPSIDADGFLNLHVTSVQFGAVDVTPFARILARGICQQRFAEIGIGEDDIQTQIAASLLDDKPFKPVFKIEGKKVRVEKITIEQKKLTIRFAPVFD
jgi:uncharacterized protein YpmS